MAVSTSIASTTLPSPDPRITPTSGAIEDFERMNAAASLMLSIMAGMIKAEGRRQKAEGALVHPDRSECERRGQIEVTRNTSSRGVRSLRSGGRFIARAADPSTRIRYGRGELETSAFCLHP